MAKLEHVQVHEGVTDSWWREGEKIWRVREQHDRAQILGANQAMREAGGSRVGDGMRWALSIPQDDYDVLVKAMPELVSTDRQIKHRAWKRFQAMELSAPYRVYEKKRGRTA